MSEGEYAKRAPMTTAHQYFQDNPASRDGVLKAYYAYHVAHFRAEPKAHNFPSGSPVSRCSWCVRTRLQVRFDDLPPECAKRPKTDDVGDVIASEERNAFALISKASRDVPKIVAKHGMSGETLALLHHTHGYDPETVSTVVEVPHQMLSDYHAAMEAERARSRAAQVKEVVMARREGQ